MKIPVTPALSPVNIAEHLTGDNDPAVIPVQDVYLMVSGGLCVANLPDIQTICPTCNVNIIVVIQDDASRLTMNTSPNDYYAKAPGAGDPAQTITTALGARYYSVGIRPVPDNLWVLIAAPMA